MATHIDASTTKDGRDITVASDTEVSLVEYQCVTSHGNTAVSDASDPVAVSYSPGKAVLRAPSASVKKGRVHIPVHDPPGVLDKTYALENILVSFDVESDASIDMVTLYYDGAKVVSTNVTRKNTFHIDFSTNEAAKYAYVLPSGICLSLDVVFQSAKSVVQLYSVTLVYRAV
ncbi:hypothetical protein JDV02_003389 [Purpureocillium takamizusanense]|uniref:Uncharacterized protein n=1 Tax=Purpureocillium takamizusanense TaxID=2060973 RepID=A0A9Q8QDK8_9HYPO|nr:uncharacterized protein JDV02_003389 [Purpureocillium takamizusanense]UNI17009.1 hypothetical protein JDV02_003389 [Purpureocillium takamizusanense]